MEKSRQLYLATLRLFNGIQVSNAEKSYESWNDEEFMLRTISNGYVLAESIPPTEEILSAVEAVVGLSGEKANATFHKSWGVVKNTPMETLVLQQCLHYMTTYGYEMVYEEQNDGYIYIPHETLEVPSISEDIPLTIIRGLEQDEIFEGIIQLSSGIALSTESLQDIMTILVYNSQVNNWDVELFIGDIKNRELLSMMYEAFDLVPSNPTEFLRYAIYHLTGQSLLIKSREAISTLKECHGDDVDELMSKAPEDLASIFFRYKPLFLAMKSVSRNKTFFNRLRKNAPKMHRPMRKDYLNSVTEMISQGTLDLEELSRKLQDVNIFRKIRLSQALAFRLNPSDSIVLQIRNGRSWVEEFVYDSKYQSLVAAAHLSILDSIADDMRDTVSGKTFYIPHCVDYVLPATQKQFVGNVPGGTRVWAGDMVAGIHWENVDGKRVDLDLSLVDVSGKIGWDASYRNDGVLFSGDLTDARSPRGATELFKIPSGDDGTWLMNLNYFNYRKNLPVPAKIIIGEWVDTHKSGKSRFTINISDALARANVTISEKQTFIGTVVREKGLVYFQFDHGSTSRRISSRAGERVGMINDFLSKKADGMVSLNEMISRCGGYIVEERPEVDEEYVDLSPEMVDKTTFLSLMGI